MIKQYYENTNTLTRILTDATREIDPSDETAEAKLMVLDDLSHYIKQQIILRDQKSK
jgi:hypothetical protein